MTGHQVLQTILREHGSFFETNDRKLWQELVLQVTEQLLKEEIYAYLGLGHPIKSVWNGQGIEWNTTEASYGVCRIWQFTTNESRWDSYQSKTDFDSFDKGYAFLVRLGCPALYTPIGYHVVGLSGT